MNTQKTSRTISVTSILLVGALAACGEKIATDDSNVTAAVSQPTDSTGVASDVALKFDILSQSSALRLVQGLDLGNGVTLTDARVNIGKIKIKPNESEDENESQLKKEMEALKEAKEEELKSQEEAWKEELESSKKDYEARIESAETDAEKKSLEDAQEAAQAAIEAKIAATKKSVEDELEEIESAKDGDLKWKGSFVYDLIQNTVSPEIPKVSLFDGTYRRIDFQLRPNRSLDGSDALLNNTIVMAGTVTVGGTAVPFTFALNATEEMRLSGSGAKMDPSVENSLVIAFKPSTWFTGTDFSSAVADSSGTIIIDSTHNTSLFSLIKKNVKSSIKFGKDDDKDGKLEDDENAGEAEEPESQE